MTPCPYTLTLLWSRGKFSPIQRECTGTVLLKPGATREDALAAIVSGMPWPARAEGPPEVVSFEIAAGV